ncbi:MAG: fumarate reductase/succinate dehydrogenase flavoprotein subunit, partial [Verrucomicrobia bacterium]
KRAGEFAAKFARENSQGDISKDQVDVIARQALEPFDRNDGENPYEIQKDLQELMQDNVGIVRTETEMQDALKQLRQLNERANRAGVIGHREYNPGWQTALDLTNLLIVSEAIALTALEREESRGAQFREDYPDKDERFAKVNTIASKAADGSMQIRLEPLPEMPEYLKQVIEKNR